MESEAGSVESLERRRRAIENARDRALLDELQSDPAVLGTLYDRHASIVYGLAMSILKDQTEAQDLTQEIFLALCDAGFSYDPARGSLVGLLATMTRSRAIDRVRRGGRRLELLKEWHAATPAAEEASAHDQLTTRREVREVRSALNDLGTNERRVLELAYYQGLSQSEIASELDAPIGSVKSWARRGLMRLKDRLEAHL